MEGGEGSHPISAAGGISNNASSSDSNSRLSPRPRTIAIIIASTRPSRLGPHIAQHIHNLLTTAPPPPPTSPLPSPTSPLTFTLLDLRSLSLPLFNEPFVPAWLPAEDPTPHYARAHARVWSAQVRGYDGVIFVTPQYNWSVPAALKNAIDYLCHEWAGKPVGIVTYGGHGGGKAGDHLRDIGRGLKMRVAEGGVEVVVPKEVLMAVGTGEVGLETVRGVWREEVDGVGLRGMVDEMGRMMGDV